MHAATWLSPRCSRSSSHARQSRPTGLSGQGWLRSPENNGRPVPSASATAAASASAAGPTSSPSSTSPRLATVAASRSASSRSRGQAARAASYVAVRNLGSNTAKLDTTTPASGSPRAAARLAT